MVIPIPIPIGVRRVATVQGSIWRFISCTHCEQPYAYLLELKARGEDHDLLFLDGRGSAERAQTNAKQNLIKKSRNIVVPVPCPHCGFYQDDMARKLKEEASINSVQITGLVITVLAIAPLWLDMPYIWVLSTVLAIAGLAVLARGYVLSTRFDPNSGDPELRKAVGRRQAIWGERLAELLAKISPAEPDAVSGRQNHER